MLVTDNINFRLDRDKTPAKKKRMNYVKSCCQEFNISSKRIVYVGKDKDERRRYVHEDVDLVRRFFNHYKIQNWANHVIFSDGDHAFWDMKNFILEEFGVKAHISYHADVHQLLPQR